MLTLYNAAHSTCSQKVRICLAEKNLLFNAQDSTPENLCFVVQDVASRKLERLLYYNRKAYEELCAMFSGAEQAQALRKLFPGPYVSARAVLLSAPAAPAAAASPPG